MAMTPEQKRKEEERRKRIAEERKRSGGFLERKAEPLTQKEKGLTKRRMRDEFEQATHKARREGTEAPQMIGGQMVYPEQQAKRKEEMQKVEVERILKERKAGREVPEEVVPEEVAEGDMRTEEERQADEQLLSGGVTPLSAEDLTDVVTMFSGLGFAKIGAKGTFKTLLAKAGKHALPTASAQVVKKGMLRAMTKKISSKIGGIGSGLIIAYAVKSIADPLISQQITKEDRQIRSIDTAMSQVRETITLPIQLARAGAPVEDCLEQIDDLRETVSYGESQIKLLEIDSHERKTNPEFTLPMKLRIAKLKGFLDLTERQIVITQVSGEGITEEALLDLMITYEEVFGNE